MASFIQRLKKPTGFSVGLFIHPRRADARDFAERKLIPYFKRRRIEVCRNEGGDLFNIAVGGDGCLLGAFRRYPRHAVPAIGIQTGDASAMLELKKQDALAQLDKIFSGQVRLVKRMRVYTRLAAMPVDVDEFQNPLYRVGGDGPAVLFTAFNEMVIRSLDGKVISMDCYIDGNLQFPIVGDGAIVATPTGSTGHSLSAGGPAVEFSSQNIILTPLAPIDRVTPCWIFEGGHTVALRLRVDRLRHIGFCVDGIQHVLVPGEHHIEFKKSPYPALLIRLLDRPFMFARAVYAKGRIYRK